MSIDHSLSEDVETKIKWKKIISKLFSVSISNIIQLHWSKIEVNSSQFF